MPSCRSPVVSPEDVLRIEATPLRDRFTARTVRDLFVEAATQWPDAPALMWLANGRASDPVVSWSFAELLREIYRAANLFMELADRRDSRVSFLLPNLPQTHFVLWGGSIAGQVNPINPLLNPAQITEIMRAAGSEVLVTAAPDVDAGVCWERAQALLGLMPELRAILVVGDTTPPGSLNFGLHCSRQPHDRLIRERTISPDDISTCFHTGGTTGTPKIAQQTHWNQVAMTWMAGFMADCTPGDRFLTALPLFHVNAAIFSGLTAFANGIATIIAGQAGFRSKHMASEFWKLVERFGVTHFSAVPTILAGLLDVPINGAQIDSLRICVCGAAPLPVSLFKKFEAATGVRILEGYGMTEGTLAMTLNPRDGERRVGSVGIRIPYCGVRVAQLDGEGRFLRDCATDEIGTILIGGDAVTPGYRQAELNRNDWALHGWFNTGDLGRLDKDGYFWLAGRAKDLIIRGGHNIDPAIIEEALQRHPAVELVAAIGKPDAYAGELPVAFVTLRSGYSATEIELFEHARSHVPERAAAPRFVRILDMMPVTAVGKIFKPPLREMVCRETVAECLFGQQGIAAICSGTTKQRAVFVVVELSPQANRNAIEALLSSLPLQTALRELGNARPELMEPGTFSPPAD
jgi:fatty-acyl-CoA synthase